MSPLRRIVLVLAIFAASLCGSANTFAAGFSGTSPVDVNDLLFTSQAPYVDGALRPDGTIEVIGGAVSDGFTGEATVKRYRPFDGSDSQGSFGSYLDRDVLQSQDFGGRVDTVRIATDAAGNSVAAWRAICPVEGSATGRGCVRAAFRAAGSSWSLPAQTISDDLVVDQYGPILVEIAAGRAVVAFAVSDNGVGPVTAMAVHRSVVGGWSTPDPILDGVAPDSGGSSRHLQDVAVDDDGTVWVAILHYSEGTEYVTRTYVARLAAGAVSWTHEQVDDPSAPGLPDANGKASIALGGGSAVVAWREHVDGVPYDHSVVVAAACDTTSGTCDLPDVMSEDGHYATNPVVAVDATGAASVMWLDTPEALMATVTYTGGGAGYAWGQRHSIVARYGESQPAGYAWNAETELVAAGSPSGGPNPSGVTEQPDSEIDLLDAGFTSDGTAIAAWQWEDPGFDQRSTHVASRAGSAGSAWSKRMVEGVVTSGHISSVAVISRPNQPDAVVLWPRRASGGGLTPAVVPYDVSGPSVTTPADGSGVTAGQSVELGVDVVDTWSAVTDPKIVWNFAGATGRRITGCFTEPGPITARITAEDAAGNPSREESFTFTVVGSAASCDSDPTPDPDPGHDPGTDGGTGGDGGTGTGGTGGTGGTVQPDQPKPDAPKPDAPKPFVLTDTVSRDKVPNVVGLKASDARDRFDRAGIDVDFDIRIINRATAPRGVTIGDVMTQAPRAGTVVQSGIGDREPVRLDVYAGPVVGKPTSASCAVTKVSAAVKGLELDLAKLVLKAMKCPYQVDVQPVAKGDDAAVTGATVTKGLITLGVQVPRKPTNNDLLLTFRENPNGISFAAGDWTLTAGQKNAFTFQATTKALYKGSNAMVQKANVTIDMSGVGGAKNLTGQTDAKGEKITVVEPPRAGYIDILVEFPGANDQSLWGTARLKVVDRSKSKAGTKLATVSGRVFQKHATGVWTHQPGATLNSIRDRNARFINFGGMVQWMQQAVAGIGGAIGSAFSAKGQSSEQVLSTALTKSKVSPSQMLIQDTLVSGNLKPPELRAGNVVSAGGGNVVSAGGANVVSAGGANVVSGGGANVVSAGGGNVVAAGAGPCRTVPG